MYINLRREGAVDWSPGRCLTGRTTSCCFVKQVVERGRVDEKCSPSTANQSRRCRLATIELKSLLLVLNQCSAGLIASAVLSAVCPKYGGYGILLYSFARIAAGYACFISRTSFPAGYAGLHDRKAPQVVTQGAIRGAISNYCRQT